MTLGLDLQGGSHILLQLDRQDLADERLETTRDDIRTLLRDAKIGYTGLSGTGKTVQVRIRDAAELEAAKTALASLLQPVASSLFGAGTITELALDEPEPGVLRYTLTDEGIDYRVGSRGDPIDRGRRPARQRTRHDRADHPAPGRRPHPRAGAGPAGPAAPEGHSRPDRQADLPDGRPDDAGAGGDRRPAAGRLDGHVFDRRSAGALSDREPRHRLGRESRRRAGVVRPAHQRAGRLVPLRFQGRAALRRRRRSRMSASCSPSSSTTR